MCCQGLGNQERACDGCRVSVGDFAQFLSQVCLILSLCLKASVCVFKLQDWVLVFFYVYWSLDSYTHWIVSICWTDIFEILCGWLATIPDYTWPLTRRSPGIGSRSPTVQMSCRKCTDGRMENSLCEVKIWRYNIWLTIQVNKNVRFRKLYTVGDYDRDQAVSSKGVPSVCVVWQERVVIANVVFANYFDQIQDTVFSAL